ncbi:unnamed protein product [Echinostoma caproni]|uniref:Fibronectin type-III domain-containing protein n=1 Tax=Echinostoma caproni TaxID=27848 RepID=A0A183ABD3_9TREM|nr:unnamed protein product [Echinostoma caproni]
MAKTTKLGAVLSDLAPGTWYQFRLLALSSEGYGGWGQPSRPIRVRSRPEPPMSPRNLTEAKTRIFENTVDVTINWQPPKGVSLPLKKYQVKAVAVFEGKELKSHPISLYLNTIPIPSRQMENESQRRKQYLVDWAPRVCIESQSNLGQDDYVPQRQTVRGSELSKVTLGNLRFQCHYKVTIKPVTERKDPTHREWFACFCTPSCQSALMNSDIPPPNCSFITTLETIQPMRLTYTVLPETRTTHDSAHISLGKQDKQRSLCRTTYNAMLNWTPLPAEVDVESRRSFRALNNVRTSKHVSTASIRGVRVTWGPRIYEPVALEAYQNGLFPHLDPESAQSKVLDPKSSTFILKGLHRETLYIVHVQPIGDHSDGPTSTVFFSIPNNAESSAPASREKYPFLVIAVFSVVMTFYLNYS